MKRFSRLIPLVLVGVMAAWLAAGPPLQAAPVTRAPTIKLAVKAPAAPGNLVAAVFGKNAVELTWQDNAENESGFKIERKDPGGQYSELKAVGPALPSLSIRDYSRGPISTG